MEQESFQQKPWSWLLKRLKDYLALVNQFPQVTFHIAALTAMGPKLTDLETCSNVHLYPGIRWEIMRSLLARCSIYLDCNQGEVNSSLHALENGQVLFGLKEYPVHQDL